MMKTIGIIALSGEVDKKKLYSAKEYLEQKGYQVKLSKNIFDKKRYLAGSDEDKLRALYEFFEDKSIDIILCARGGYGSIRLINKIDFEIIRKNPKVFCGFSDITALLLMIYKKTGLITYHGPMACSDFGEIESISDFTEQNFYNALNSNNLEFIGNNIYRSGNANGIIWGGNLATIASLCGQDFIPEQNFIFFAEDLSEPVYKIDKMFTQLFNIAKFRSYCKGIVLGDFLDSGNEEWLNELFTEIADNLQIPVSGGFKVTHNKDKITLPIGKNAILTDNVLQIN